MCKNICIYPIDKSTDFLQPIYSLLSERTDFICYRINTNIDDDKMNEIRCRIGGMNNKGFVFFLGHGSSYCLYGTPDKNDDKTDLFKKSEIIQWGCDRLFFLSCRSSELVPLCTKHRGIGFGEMPTSFDEIIAEREQGDSSYMSWVKDTEDIKLYTDAITSIIARSIKLCGETLDISTLYKYIQLFTNKELMNILIHRNHNNYREIAVLLNKFQKDIVYT